MARAASPPSACRSRWCSPSIGRSTSRVDGNKTLGGIDPARVLNPLHPVASGGFIGDGTTLTEDFTALTAGATYRADRWSVTGRAEYRAGERENRYGVTVAALRQIGEGRAVGGAFNWFTAEAAGGARDAHRQSAADLGPPAAEQRLLLPRQVRAARGQGDRRRRRHRRADRIALHRSPATPVRGGSSIRSSVNYSPTAAAKAAIPAGPSSRSSGARATSPIG